MKWITFAILLPTILLYMPISAFAGGESGDWSIVTSMYNYTSGDVRVWLSPQHNDPDDCGQTGYVHLEATADKSVYATLLTALLTGREVKFFLSGCTTISGATAAKITRIAIKH